MADSAEGRGRAFPDADRSSTGRSVQGDARAAGRGRQSARLPHLHLEQRAGDDGDLHGDGVGRLRPQHAGARFPARRPLLGRRLVADGQRLRGGAEDQRRARARSSPRWRRTCPRTMPPSCCGAASCRSTASPRRSTRPRPRRSSARRGSACPPPVAGEPVPAAARRVGVARQRHVRASAALTPSARLAPPLKGEGGRSCSLDEAEAKALLAEAGLPVPAGQARRQRRTKPSLPRKRSRLSRRAEGARHRAQIRARRRQAQPARRGRRCAPRPNALAGLGTGLYVERMVHGGVAELIVGITRDPIFGPVMTIGSGGVLVELLKDSRDAAAAGDARRDRSGVARPENVSAARRLSRPAEGRPRRGDRRDHRASLHSRWQMPVRSRSSTSTR